MAFSTSSGPTVPQSVIDDGNLRVVFKLYFLLVILGIAVAGSYCVQFYIQRRLLKGKPVRLTMTTGWVHGPLLAKISYQMRGLPGGWLGVLMLLATALELTAEFGIAKSITLVTQKARATARYGMIIDERSQFSRYPDVVYQSFTTAQNAQAYSYNNRNFTGLDAQAYGIYRFVNPNDYNILPTEQDIIGYWSCPRKTQTSIAYDAANNNTVITDQSILNDLTRRGLLYPAGNTFSNTNISYIAQNGSFLGASYQVTLWTASNYTLGSAPNFTFGVETRSNADASHKEMDVFQCTLYATEPNKTVITVLENIDFNKTMTNWVKSISGALYPGFAVLESWDETGVKGTLEYYLNAMIMVAGSTQNIDTENTLNLDYGIFEYATVIPYWIIAIAVITFALLLFLLGYLIFLWLSNKRLRNTYEKEGSHRVASKDIMDNTPVGLMGWMRQAAATSRDASVPEEGQLRKWILSTTWHGDKRLGVVKAEEHGLMDGERERSSEDTYVRKESPK